MKMKSDFVTNSSSTSYIFSSDNKSHKKDKIIVGLDITKIGGVGLEEITWDVLKKIEETGDYNGENVLFSLSEGQLEQCKEILNSDKKAFYISAYDEGGPLGFLDSVKGITIIDDIGE